MLREKSFPTVCVLMVGACLSFCAGALAHGTKTLVASVFTDSKKPAVTVSKLEINLEPSSFGFYNRSEYPSGAFVPLDTGEQVPFAKLSELVLMQQWVDDEVHGRKTKALVVQCTLTLTTAKKVEERLVRPGAVVSLVGETSLGKFQKALEPGRSVRIVFRAQ